MTVPIEQGTSPLLIGPNRVVTTAVLVSMGILSLGMLAIIVSQRGRIASMAERTAQMFMPFAPRSALRPLTAATEPYPAQIRQLPGEPLVIPVPATPARATSDVATFVGPDDYPMDALRREQQGRVKFEVRIDPAGRARRCFIVETSHVASLDSVTCRLAIKRLRFSPARDAAGRPLWASYTRRIVWLVPS